MPAHIVTIEHPAAFTSATYDDLTLRNAGNQRFWWLRGPDGFLPLDKPRGDRPLSLTREIPAGRYELGAGPRDRGARAGFVLAGDGAVQTFGRVSVAVEAYRRPEPPRAPAPAIVPGSLDDRAAAIPTGYNAEVYAGPFHVAGNPELAGRTFRTLEEAYTAKTAAGSVGRIARGPAPTEAAQAPAPRVEVNAPATDPTRGQVESAAMVADRAALDAAGIIMPATRRGGLITYADGQVAKLAYKRAEWEKTPTIESELERVIAAVRAEERADVVVDARDLYMTDDGDLRIGGDTVLALESEGFGRLLARCSAVFPRGGEMMRALEPDVRAHVWNRQIRRLTNEREIKLRTRAIASRAATLGSPARRAVYAVVSGQYADHDADRTAEVFLRALEGQGYRGRAVYDGAETNLLVDATLHRDAAETARAGEVHQVGIRLRSNDAAGGSIEGSALAFRPRCLNMAVIDTGERAFLRRQHRGAVADVREEIRLAGQRAAEMFRGFAERWGLLRAAPIAVVAPTVPAALEALAEMPQLDVGIKRDALVEMLLRGFAEEPGETVADLVNAVTRVHTLESVDRYQRERIERGAGELVTVLARRAESHAADARRGWVAPTA